ncbi:hypothetical protein ODR38_09650 [Pediococcus acidilactici]
MQRAQTVLEKVVDMDSSYSSVYPYLIDAYRRDEEWDKGLTAAQEGLAADQYNPDLYLLAAEMAEHAHDDELVEKYLQKAVELAPDIIKFNFSNAVYLDLDIQKSLHDYQMNYVISSDNHKGIITSWSIFS